MFVERVAGLQEMMHNNIAVLQILGKERVYHNVNKMTQIGARLTGTSYVWSLLFPLNRRNEQFRPSGRCPI